MKLYGILQREIRQRKANTVWSHLYVESKKKTEHTERMIIGGFQGKGIGEMGEGR